MKLTCAQMDVLITFYIDKELSDALKSQVEEHLKKCPTCQAKYDIVKSMIAELKSSYESSKELSKAQSEENKVTSEQFRLFKNNLSAYMDNELSNEESLKIKKYTINNTHARKELEDNYCIRKIMRDSFNKSEADARRDFSRQVLKQLELEEEATSGFHPAIKLLIIFTISSLIFTSIVLFFIGI